MMVDEILADFRNYPRPFIWLAEDTLAQKQNWVQEEVSRPVLIERLLLLVDNLTNQAKRRDRDEALWLRSAAGDAGKSSAGITMRSSSRVFRKPMRISLNPYTAAPKPMKGWMDVPHPI